MSLSTYTIINSCKKAIKLYHKNLEACRINQRKCDIPTPDYCSECDSDCNFWENFDLSFLESIKESIDKGYNLTVSQINGVMNVYKLIKNKNNEYSKNNKT